MTPLDAPSATERLIKHHLAEEEAIFREMTGEALHGLSRHLLFLHLGDDGQPSDSLQWPALGCKR